MNPQLNLHGPIKYIVGVALLAVIGVFFLPPIPQDPSYHNFADSRTLFAIPNGLNVLSNIPFLIVGMVGIRFLSFFPFQGGLRELRFIYIVFFLGVFLTGIGSGYYHWQPTNKTLLWDRLPMTLSFMAFFCAMIGETISPKLGCRLFWPLIAIGIFSVLYWHVTESRGHGDLRLYAIVQFIPLLIIPLLLGLLPARFTSHIYLWGFVGAYLLSKVAEVMDGAIFHTLGAMSGHSIKHIVAAIGTYAFYLALRDRVPLEVK